MLKFFVFLLTLKCVISQQETNFVCHEDTCTLQNFSSTSEVINILSSLSGLSFLDQNSYYRHQTRSEQFSKFTEVSFSNTNFKEIPGKIFEKFSTLKRFTASNVGIEVLNRESFKHATYLICLELSGNKIANLENMVFIYLKKLSIIDLSRNEILTINEGAFDDIGFNLKEINLSYNILDTFSENHLIKLGQSSANNISINLESNKIVKIPISNLVKPSRIHRVNLQNNEIVIFNSTNLEIAELIINRNQLEVLNVVVVTVLEANNNKLKKLFISKTLRKVTAINNEIRELNCDKNLLIESLSLSENQISSEALAELKNAEELKFLSLSNSKLGSLPLNSFAEMENLEVLNLNNSKIQKIPFGLFSHQKKLKILNIANNYLKFIDYHVFTSLESLKSWDVSGNNLTVLEDHEKFQEIFPNLRKIGLEENTWSCEYLSKLRLSLEKQGIKVDDPVNPIKNESNVKGIGCLTEKNTIINELPSDNNSTKALAKLNEVIGITNNLITQINEVRSNESTFKDLIFSLQKEIFDLKNEHLKNKISSVNSTSINEVRTIVEQMNNMTLERQKLANDQLMHKINEQSLEISKHKVEMEKLLMNVRADDPKLQAQQIQEKPTGVSIIDILVIMVCVAIFFGVVVFGVNYFKNYIKSSIFQQQPTRISRRNSINTITTLNDSTL